MESTLPPFLQKLGTPSHSETHLWPGPTPCQQSVTMLWFTQSFMMRWKDGDASCYIIVILVYIYIYMYIYIYRNWKEKDKNCRDFYGKTWNSPLTTSTLNSPDLGESQLRLGESVARMLQGAEKASALKKKRKVWNESMTFYDIYLTISRNVSYFMIFTSVPSILAWLQL